jgi:hypothetical protein
LPFTLVGLTAGFAGIVYESRLGSISVGFDGGTYVLYAVAAAVIGGASLMGGRGKAIHPLIGGLVLAVVANGLDLLNITTAGQDMATALVNLMLSPSTLWCGVVAWSAARAFPHPSGVSPRPPRSALTARSKWSCREDMSV